LQWRVKKEHLRKKQTGRNRKKRKLVTRRKPNARKKINKKTGVILHMVKRTLRHSKKRGEPEATSYS